MDINKIHNGDCLEAMKKMKDNEFDLAIVDPPYGIGASEMTMGSGKNKKYKKGKKWDNETPTNEYFLELQRVSKNQIIWGANYMTTHLPPSTGWIYWDKLQNKEGHRYGKSFASGELAFSSFDKPLQHFEYKYQGNYVGSPNNITTKTKLKQEIKIHPTQKPIKLYEWLIMNYAKEGDKILDTHLGSGSIAIACHNLGYDLTGYELDKEYYDNAIKRIKNHQAQLRIL